MKAPEIDEESIAKLMHSFYFKVRFNEHLGPVFAKRIPDDDQSWERHKEHIGSFWEGVLLGKVGFKGAPLQAHYNLMPFPQELFYVWLALFEESLDEVYEEEPKAIFMARAEGIASKFMANLYQGY